MADFINSNWIKTKDDLITNRRLGFIFFLIFSIIAAILLALLPFKLQFAVIAIVPAVVVGIVVLMNVYAGVLLYFLCEYLRPVDIFPAFEALRVTMIIELLMLISWIVSLSRNHRNIRWERFNTIYILLIALMGLTIITAANNRFAYDTTQAMFTVFVIFLIATNVVDTKERLSGIVWLILIIHLYHSYKGFVNYFVVGFINAAGDRSSGRTGSGFIGDEADFALALIAVIPFAYYYFVYAKTPSKKYFSLIVFFVFTIGVMISSSRGGFVGLVTLMVFSIFYSKKKWLGIAMTIFAAIAMTLFASSDYWQKIMSIKQTDQGTARLRRLYWMAGVRMMMDNPLTGVGAGNGPVRMPEYVQGFRDRNTQWGRTFHGTIPQVMGELGVFGIIMYLALMIYALKTVANIRKLPIANHDETIMVISSAIPASIIGYIVTATFLSAAYYPQMWTLYSLTFILKNIAEKENSRICSASCNLLK